jgi:ribosomal protein S18 acetylase RimI-like enzyme
VIIAERKGVALRQAQEADLPRVAQIAVDCYRPIHDYYLTVLGEEGYRAMSRNPEQTWEARKSEKLRLWYVRHPQWLWVLDDSGELIGFVSFAINPAKQVAGIKNNGVIPARCGQGWATFMYREVLRHFRQQGMRFAYVDTGVDPVHEAAQKAYQAVGFDRTLVLARHWQDLTQNNPGSMPE